MPLVDVPKTPTPTVTVVKHEEPRTPGICLAMFGIFLMVAGVGTIAVTYGQPSRDRQKSLDFIGPACLALGVPVLLVGCVRAHAANKKMKEAVLENKTKQANSSGDEQVGVYRANSEEISMHELVLGVTGLQQQPGTTDNGNATGNGNQGNGFFNDFSGGEVSTTNLSNGRVSGETTWPSAVTIQRF